jgi:hypothetical protein
MHTQPTDQDVRMSRKAARFYKRMGWNPLPSRSDDKAPALKAYRHLYREPLDAETFGRWWTANIQLVTGTPWHLAVVDCDGSEAGDEFARWCLTRGGIPLTWIVRSGGGGLHYYFTMPTTEALPYRMAWGVWDYLGGPKYTGAWAKGRKIEVIGDDRLIVAPPSIHPKTGVRYQFLPGRSPREIPRPLELPGWIAELPAMAPPDDAREPLPVAQEAPRVAPALGETSFDRDDVLDALRARGIVAIAEGLGLVFAGYIPNDAGWCSVHAASQTHPGVGSTDEKPSARFHPEKGLYCEMYDRRVMSFFDMAAILRPAWFRTWQDALNHLGKQYGAVPYSRSTRRRRA